MLIIHDEDKLLENPSDAEVALSSSIGELGLSQIDNQIIAALTNNWQKVAMVIFKAMESGGYEFTDEAVELHARRIVYLDSISKLKSNGNLFRPRFSEIKL
jgi:hypothetical protein